MIQQYTEMVNANLSAQQNAGAVAQEIQTRINAANAQGWECVGITNVQASVAGSPGCFGIGATFPYSHSVCILLFRRTM